MTTKTYEKALPHLDGDTKPFWEYCKRHELRLQKCKDCGVYIWHPRRFCGNCLSDNTEWVKASGKGSVYTYTIVRQTYARGWREEIPYVVAYIELEEGIRLMSNVVGIEPERVHIGMPVEVVFDDVTEEFTLPKFRPVAS